MATKNYQTQCLLVIHKKAFLNAEHVIAAKKTSFPTMLHVSVLYFMFSFSYNHLIHLSDNFVQYLENILTETIQGAYAVALCATFKTSYNNYVKISLTQLSSPHVDVCYVCNISHLVVISPCGGLHVVIYSLKRKD